MENREASSTQKAALCVLVSVDIETTGLKVYEDQITEFAAKSVLFYNDCSFDVLESLDDEKITGENENNNELQQSDCCLKPKKDVFQRYVKCAKAIGIKSQQITGITEKKLQNAPLITEMFQFFVQYMTHISNSVPKHTPLVLVAHNGIKFDLPVVVVELERNGLSAIKYMRQLKFSYLLDTVVLARDVVDTLRLPRDNTGKPCFKLGGIYEMLCGRPLVGAHGAAADCSAVLELLLLYDCFRNAFCGDWNGPKKYFKNIMTIVSEIVEQVPKKLTLEQEQNKPKTKKMKNMLHFFKPIEK